MLFGIGFGQCNRFLCASRQAHIIQRLVINAKETTGRAIFRRHIGKRGTIRQRQRRETRAVIFDKAANHTVIAQHLCRGQHKVGGGDALGQRSGQFETDNFGDQHRDRLPQHCGFGFNPAHAPAKHAKAVDHRRVAVGANAGVGIRHQRAVTIGRCPYCLCNMFQIDLMANAGAWRNGFEVVQRLAAPFQKVIAFAIAVIFNLDILLCRLWVTKFVHHHRVVDDQMDGNQRVNL